MTVWKKLKDPRIIRAGLNIWPPFLGAGISVEAIEPNFRYVRVALRSTFFNRNYVGTHFGGSLFAMTDPFFMLMLMQNMGEQYYVWDRSAEIEFVAPGKGKVVAELRITDEDLHGMRAATESGEKYERDFVTEVVDAEGAVVARVRKRIYARLKPAFRPTREHAAS